MVLTTLVGLFFEKVESSSMNSVLLWLWIDYNCTLGRETKSRFFTPFLGIPLENHFQGCQIVHSKSRNSHVYLPSTVQSQSTLSARSYAKTHREAQYKLQAVCFARRGHMDALLEGRVAVKRTVRLQLYLTTNNAISTK
jgi:hypothetical protein